jgi:hypothetical protein
MIFDPEDEDATVKMLQEAFADARAVKEARMCNTTDIAAKARMKLRDFGHYFEVPYTAVPSYTPALVPTPSWTARSHRLEA